MWWELGSRLNHILAPSDISSSSPPLKWQLSESCSASSVLPVNQQLSLFTTRKILCTRKMTVYVISKKKEKKHYHKNIEIHKSTTHVLLALCKCDLYTPTNLVVVAPVLKYHLSAVHSKLTSTKVYTSPKQHSGW